MTEASCNDCVYYFKTSLVTLLLVLFAHKREKLVLQGMQPYRYTTVSTMFLVDLLNLSLNRRRERSRRATCVRLTMSCRCLYLRRHEKGDVHLQMHVTHTHTHTHAPTYPHTRTYPYLHLHVSTHSITISHHACTLQQTHCSTHTAAHTHTHVHTHTHAHTHTHTHTQTQTHTHTHKHTHSELCQHNKTRTYFFPRFWKACSQLQQEKVSMTAQIDESLHPRHPRLAPSFNIWPADGYVQGIVLLLQQKNTAHPTHATPNHYVWLKNECYFGYHYWSSFWFLANKQDYLSLSQEG